MAGYIVLALFLLSVGLVGLLYSSWAQEAARKALDSQDVDAEATHRRHLRPALSSLRVEATDVALTSCGDTVMAAPALDAEVSLLPLPGEGRGEPPVARRRPLPPRRHSAIVSPSPPTVSASHQ